MADFYKVVAPTLNFEGGYQNQSSDPGNYCQGNLIGTNHGISAPALAQYIGRCPSVAEMKALTVDKAKDIYKKLFWDALINGDKIKDQYVAFICFQCVIGANVNLIYARQGINAVAKKYGKTLVQEGAIAFNDYTANIINSLPAKEVFQSIYNTYYARLVWLNDNYYKPKGNPQPGWFTRMQTIQKWAYDGYAKAEQFVEDNPIKTTVGVAFFVLARWGIRRIARES